jgi:hypothetical protein
LPKFVFEGREALKNFKISFFVVSFSPLYPTKEKRSSVVSHKEKKLFRCIPLWRKASSIVSHNEKKPLPLYPTTEENRFHCGIQRKKTCGVVGYNAENFSGIQYTA